MPLNWGVVVFGVIKMEYPKALYKGTQSKRDMQIAETGGHEDELRNQGYVDFAELPESEPRYSGEVDSLPKETNTKEIDSLKVELLQALKDKEEIENNFIGFRNDVEAMKARIAELEPINALTLMNQNNDPDPPTPIHYSEMTSEQLREEIKKVGKTFNVRDSKAKLIEILEGK